VEVEQIASSGSSMQEETNAKSLLAFVFEDPIPIVVEPLIFSSPSLRLANPGKKENNGTIERKITAYENYVKVFPNPANENLTVEYNLGEMNTENIVFMLFDMSGRPVINRQTNTQSGKININLNSLSQGFYTFKILINETVIVQDKLVIVKN